MTVTEAHEKYVAAEDAASKNYLEFWIERFKAAGIVLEPSGDRWWYPHKVTLDGYEIDAYTHPAHYTGIKLNIIPLPAVMGHPRYYTLKVKSEVGFKRLIRRLHNRDYK